VGVAKIKAGDAKVTVTFRDKYEYLPIITATIIGLHDVQYGVDNIKVESFDIVVDQPQAEDLTFNWHSFSSAAETEIVVSDGTMEKFNIIVVEAPIVSENPGLGDNSSSPVSAVTDDSLTSDSNNKTITNPEAMPSSPILTTESASPPIENPEPAESRELDASSII
jgi:hypothetical protein